MKTKSISALLFASVLLFNVGCEDNDSIEPRSPEDLVITNIRQLGTPVKNPINSEKCNDSESAKTTLSSLRRISDRFYYMDFTTNLHFEKLVANEMPTNSSNHNAMEEL